MSTQETTECVKPTINPALIEGVENFQSSELKHVEATQEKIVLPSKEDIESEKQHINLVTSLESFDKKQLKPTVTQEKIVLPDVDGIETEKKHVTLVTSLESFDKKQLKPTVTQEKIILPDKDEIESERRRSEAGI
jgi:ribosomal protein L14E/L6E/L27E